MEKQGVPGTLLGLDFGLIHTQLSVDFYSWESPASIYDSDLPTFKNPLVSRDILADHTQH